MRIDHAVVCLGLALGFGAVGLGSATAQQAVPGYYPGAQPGSVAYGQPLRPMPRPQSNYGGGLIEALIGPAQPERAPAYVAPQSYVASAQPGYAYADPQQAYAQGAYAVQPGKALDPMYQRQEVAFDGREAPGTIVVDTQNKFLYLVEGGGQAMRYGIGVGRPGFLWHGTKVITRKAEWPDWTPPSEMLLRRPDLPTHMEGGIANPLGARAMYLGSSLYRIHGTNEPETIGTNVSSGCIRLTNDDVSDLYSRVKVGTHVVVL